MQRTRKEVESRYPQLFCSLDFGAYLTPVSYFVSYIFCTNQELEQAEESDLLGEINEYHKECMKKTVIRYLQLKMLILHPRKNAKRNIMEIGIISISKLVI